MKSAAGQIGRVFVLRLEDGDTVPQCIEQFAAANAVAVGFVLLLGGIGRGKVVVGPRDSDAMLPQPMLLPITAAHEIVAAGIIAPDTLGAPRLHIHGALGRGGDALAGCLREGVTTWLVAEAVVCEITGASAARLPDAASGFTLLEPAQ